MIVKVKINFPKGHSLCVYWYGFDVWTYYIVENSTMQNKNKKNNNLVTLNSKVTRKLKNSKHYPPC